MATKTLFAVFVIAVLLVSFARCGRTVPQRKGRCKGRLLRLRSGVPNIVAQLKQITSMLKSLQAQVAKLQECSCKDNNKVYKDCAELYKAGMRKNGVYTINPDYEGEFQVYCDQTTAGGGWTVIQKRFDGSVDFDRDWNGYKIGFGCKDGEYWLGLLNIYRLTHSGKYGLRVDLVDTKGNTRYASYSSFSVGNESTKYKLSLGTYKGTAGDSLRYHVGSPFSTKDRDNDASSKNCAVTYKSAWWYNSCHTSSLNGKYRPGPIKTYADGVVWYHWLGYNYSLKGSQMAVRPADFSPLSFKTKKDQ